MIRCFELLLLLVSVLAFAAACLAQSSELNFGASRRNNDNKWKISIEQVIIPLWLTVPITVRCDREVNLPQCY